MEHTKDRTWAEVRLDNIEHNYNKIKKNLPKGCKFLGAVKANAYGHGAVSVSRLLSSLGADYLAVASIDEAADLRKAGIKLPILVLGYTAPDRTVELLDLDLTQTIYSLELAESYSHYCLGQNIKLKCHLKLDSGMGRLGIMCDKNGLTQAVRAVNLSGLFFEGIFTHFAVSDVLGDDYTNKQFSKFLNMVSHIEADSNKKFCIVHCSNSGALINFPDMYLDMVRPGIALYGAYEEDSPNLNEFDLRQGMELKTRIVQIKEIPVGFSVSYGRTFSPSNGPRKIAVLPIGYADGLFRGLSNNMEMLLNGQRIKQIGKICMDMCMVDVTEVNSAVIGDIVTVFGFDGNEFISISEHTKKIGTITYEMLCSVTKRVPRVYIR